MKKKILLLILTILPFLSYPEIKLPDYNKSFGLPFTVKSPVTSDESSDRTAFSFKIGKIDGDISIFGYWKLKLGYGLGFTSYPDFAWILNVPNMKSGVIFEQERVFALDWVTDNGINLHLFFNDDVNATEYTFKYTLGKIFNSLYITNKFNGLEVNPYRTLKGGKAQDINFGFDWQYKFYKGRFDIQFDSVKKNTDTFKGGKIAITNRFLSSQYVRGSYFYLPDVNITGDLEVYVSDDLGELFTDLPSGFSEARRYKTLKEGSDFRIDPINGLLTFKESVFGKTVLVFYQANVVGHIYNVGDTGAGINGFHGTSNFDALSHPEYIVNHSGRNFLVLNFQKKNSDFEEKNSYRLAGPGSKISGLNFDIFDKANLRLNGFSGIYDEYGGCLRLVRNNQKGTDDNIYPFSNFETDPDYFYRSFNSPNDSFSNNRIDYSCLVSGQGMKLSAKPVASSIRVLLNSVPLSAGQFSYDYLTMILTVSFEINDTDIVEVQYVTDEQDAYNLTAALKNDFRINDYLLIGDSVWYKMPLKLWEDSYYFKLHSMEFMYSVHFTGDFKKLLKDDTAKLGFDANATLSVFHPELKGITIVEDFEYQLKGLALDLDYKKWFPVNYPSIAGITGYGKLFFRNTHKYGVKTNSTYISLYDSPPSADDYSGGSGIGPYSSSDGYYDEKNSLSLVTEFELAANQAVSVSLPLNNDKDTNYSAYSELVAAIKSLDLNGSVDVYIDAGETAEKFYPVDATVQKEVLDEGLSYYISSGNFYLFKGKSDGINSTNDFNGNGILDADGIISSFTDIASPASLDHVTIGAGEKKIVNFKITTPSSLRNIRALRLTVYNPGATTVNGKLIINQLRLTETGWEYDRTKFSDAVEIYPAEDPVLGGNIFSKNNPDFDKRLHVQRVRERTMRIRLQDNEQFYIRKKFTTPLEISYFKKFGFFILPAAATSRTIRITLKDTAGHDMIMQTDLSGLAAGQWKQLEYYFDAIGGYTSSNKTIAEMTIEFLNPGAGMTFNKIFLDEFYMDEATPLVGFGTRNTFEYTQPGLDLKYGTFSIFRSPSFKITTGFNTENFLRDEMHPFKGYQIDNDMSGSFRFVTVDFFTQSTLYFVFKNLNFYNPLEALRIKISRNATPKLPLIFTVYYDYKKSGIPDTADNFILNSVTQDRRLMFEAGAETKPVFFKAGYDIATSIRTVSYNTDRLYGEFRLSLYDINTRVMYSISNKILRDRSSGNFSLDNLGYVFDEDFTGFGYDGVEKNQNFEIHSGFSLIPEIKFTSDITYANKGSFLNYNSNFVFTSNYSNHAGIALSASYKGQRKNIFIFDISRKVDNSYYKTYETLRWKDYFTNFSDSTAYLTPVFFYPLFSSVFKTGDKYYFDDGTRFGLTSDNLKFTFDWSLFLEKKYFLPNKFSFNVIETINNSVAYVPEYNFILSLSGSGETAAMYVNKCSLEYILTENMRIRKGDNNYLTQALIVFEFVLYNGIDIETSFGYDIDYTEGLYKKEFHHTLTLKTKLYKDFFKKDFITGDKSGVELTFLFETNSSFYYRLDVTTEMTDNPLRMYLTPAVGYRFNKNITVRINTMYGYSMDYYQRKDEKRHNFGLEISIEGIFNF